MQGSSWSTQVRRGARRLHRESLRTPGSLVGYYWAPTAILGKYEMVKVDFGTGADEAHFKKCITQAECDNPKPTMYPPSPVHTVTASSFADRLPEAFAYLSKRAFNNAEMNRQLVWIEANQADGDTAATHFLKNFEPVWSAWLSADIAAKVKKAIAGL